MFGFGVKIEFSFAVEPLVAMIAGESLLFVVNSLDVIIQISFGGEFFLTYFTRECHLFVDHLNMFFQMTF